MLTLSPATAIVIRHTPDHFESTNQLRQLLAALKAHFHPFNPAQISLSLELTHESHLRFSQQVWEATDLCNNRGITTFSSEKTWDSAHVYALRQACEVPYLFLLPSTYVPHQDIRFANPSIFSTHPSLIYLRFVRRHHEITVSPRTSTTVLPFRFLSPDSEDYYTDDPHVLCTACFRRQIHNNIEMPQPVPPSAWPRYESAAAVKAKRRKHPFEFGVTTDSYFTPSTGT